MSGSEAEKIIPESQFVSLVRLGEATRKTVAEANGKFGEKVKSAVENTNLHPGAFAIIRKLHKMTEEKRDDFLRALPIYIEIAEKLLWAGDTHVGDFVDQAAKAPLTVDEQKARDDAEFEAESERAGKANGKKIASGIRKLEDTDAHVDAKSPDNLPGDNVTPLKGGRKGKGLPGAEGRVQ